MADDVVGAFQAVAGHSHEAEVDVGLGLDVGQGFLERGGGAVFIHARHLCAVVLVIIHPVAIFARLGVVGCVEGQHVGAIVDAGVGAVAHGLKTIVVRLGAEGGQCDGHIHRAEGLGAVGGSVEHAFAVVLFATHAPDAEVTLAVTHGMVLVRHLHAWVGGVGAVQGEGVLISIVADPTTVVRVVEVAALSK